MELDTVPLIKIALTWGPKIGLALVIILLFWLIASTVKRTICNIGQKTHLNDHVMNMIAQTFRIVILLLGIISALGTLGINVGVLITGLGLTGFAVGFALKDTISNLLSGMLLLMYQPFSLNDRISVSGKEGVVIAINLRYTTLENGNTRILIPNSSLFTNAITIIDNEQTQ